MLYGYAVIAEKLV